MASKLHIADSEPLLIAQVKIYYHLQKRISTNIKITNAANSGTPIIEAVGESDSNVSLVLKTKGSGALLLEREMKDHQLYNPLQVVIRIYHLKQKELVYFHLLSIHLLQQD